MSSPQQNTQVSEHAQQEPRGMQFANTTDMILDFKAMDSMSRLAEMMANGRATVPQHLQGNPADCMAIIMQAAQWQMNPFAVAQKTHVVNGVLGYEAQLVNAVVCSSTKVKDSFHYEWFGDWTKVIGNFVTKTSSANKQYQAPAWTAADEKGLGIRVWATLKGESEPRLLELLLSQAQVRNSTLWASDPKQQLAYLAVKRWARLYAPDVILGVYSADELDDLPEKELNPISSTAERVQELPPYPADKFKTFLPAWTKKIHAGQLSAQEVIDMVSAKYQLSHIQVDTLLDVEQQKPIEGEYQTRDEE